MSMKKLSTVEVEQRLGQLPDWTLDEGKLYRHFVFNNFLEAFGFMTQVAMLAETLNHHPEWSNVWSRVEIHLTTHDCGGISELDFELAGRINTLLG
ncbi:MAG: 4a-hydroxytetrahydrobiopterin dehydratase [Pseudomonadota bacterium]